MSVTISKIMRTQRVYWNMDFTLKTPNPTLHTKLLKRRKWWKHCPYSQVSSNEWQLFNTCQTWLFEKESPFFMYCMNRLWVSLLQVPRLRRTQLFLGESKIGACLFCDDHYSESILSWMFIDTSKSLWILKSFETVGLREYLMFRIRLHARLFLEHVRAHIW